MANSKDNLSKYGKAFIGFDEPSGNAMDSIGGYTGTLYNSPTRVTGWNGQGNAMNFNGSNQYVEFNNLIIPNTSFSIRFKIKFSQINKTQYIFGTNDNSSNIKNIGVYVTLMENNSIRASIRNSTGVDASCFSTIEVTTDKWYDILFIWDKEIKSNNVKLYVNDMKAPNATTLSMTILHIIET